LSSRPGSFRVSKASWYSSGPITPLMSNRSSTAS
jgi:hypothetical protein